MTQNGYDSQIMGSGDSIATLDNTDTALAPETSQTAANDRSTATDAAGSQPTLARETRPVAGARAEPDNATVVERDPGAVFAQRQEVLHRRYGGMSWGSAFIGSVIALFFSLLFLSIVGAIAGEVGFQLHSTVPKIGGSISGSQVDLGVGALAGSLLAVFLGYLIGGYTAGRMARFDGALNGLGVWFWTIFWAIVLGAVGQALGTRFDLASQWHFHVDWTQLTLAGGISIAVTLIVMLLGAVAGGIMGANYHRAIDRDAATLE